MSVDKSMRMQADGVNITVRAVSGEDYISLTDMARHEGGNPGDVIRRWLRLSDTIQFLRAWEQMSNPEFRDSEAQKIQSQSGRNIFSLSASEWIRKTNAIGLQSARGRSGGTYAHRDIAFSFAEWISPEFHLFVVRDYRRLEAAERERLGLEWDARRELAKTNYRLHTDALKSAIDGKDLPKWREKIEYASEADLINLVVFGQKASTWKQDHPGWKGNMRDYASAESLTILQNIELLGSILIEQGLDKEERFRRLVVEAGKERETLGNKMRSVERLQRIIDKSEGSRANKRELEKGTSDVSS